MIPVNEPRLGERELEYVTECVRGGWVSSAGRFIEEFEQGWAGYCGRRYGVALCNGTAALQVAAAALDLQPGDEVVMPTFTIISCAQAVVYAGGVPAYAGDHGGPHLRAPGGHGPGPGVGRETRPCRH